MPPDAGLALRTFLREVLRQRFSKYRRALDRCRKRPSEKAVHDVRVESRRLLAVLGTLQGLVPARTCRSAATAVRDGSRGLGSLRDIQVQLAALKALTQTWPLLTGLCRRLERRARRRGDKAADRLDRKALRRAERAVSDVRKALRNPPRPARAVPPHVPALAAASDGVARAFDAVDPARPGTIHLARKRLRRLRDLIEVFESVLPLATARQLAQLHDWQIAMGRIQDAIVLEATVDRYLRRHVKSRQEAARVREFLERRRQTLVRRFFQGLAVRRVPQRKALRSEAAPR
jgi:CHAD domain-containing protein